MLRLAAPFGVIVQQPMAAEIGRGFERRRAAEIFGRAHDEKFFAHQQAAVQPFRGRRPQTEDQGQIDAFALQIDGSIFGAHDKIDLRMIGVKTPQARDEPFVGERSQNAQRHRPRRLLAGDAVDDARDLRKRGLAGFGQAPPGAGQFEAATAAAKQADSELALQALHALADGALRNLQFARGGGETEMARDRQKRAHRAQRVFLRHRPIRWRTLYAPRLATCSKGIVPISTTFVCGVFHKTGAEGGCQTWRTAKMYNRDCMDLKRCFPEMSVFQGQKEMGGEPCLSLRANFKTNFQGQQGRPLKQPRNGKHK